MSNILKRNFNHLITLGLRFAALVYLFSTFFPFIVDPGFESDFGNWTMRWGLIVLTAVIALGIFILKRSDFMLYGFFLVFIASMFQVFQTLISNDRLPAMFLHLYVLATSLYFATKSMRSTQRSQPRKKEQIQPIKLHRTKKTTE